MSPAHPWTAAEVTALAVALDRAPSVHNTQPWHLDVTGDRATLHLTSEVDTLAQDPDGRDRVLSCGAALTNLRLAARGLGWSADWAPYPDPRDRSAVAVLRPGAARTPTAADLALLGAVRSRRSHRGPFGREPVDEVRLAAALAVEDPGVRLLPLRSRHRVGALATVLGRAGRAYRADPDYQRELDAWTVPGPATGAGRGLPNRGRRGSLPSTGLVGPGTVVPDDTVLARRLAGEHTALLLTRGDSDTDHLRAGMALETAWLACTAAGLAAGVLTWFLHPADLRSELTDLLGCGGHPHALLRVGAPGPPHEPSPRLPLTRVVSHHHTDDTTGRT